MDTPTDTPKDGYKMSHGATFKACKNIGRGGIPRWYLHIPARYSSTGKAQRVYYPTKRQCEQAGRQWREQIRAYGEGVALLNPETTRDVNNILIRLAPYGVTLDEVVTEWIALQAKVSSETIEALAPKYLANKQGSDRYMSQVRKYMAHLVDHFRGMCLDDIAPADFAHWLEATNSTPTQYNHALRTIKPFFAWAIRYEYAGKSPARACAPRRVQASTPSILTVAQSRKLLKAASRIHGCLTPVALLMYTGVRPAELTRLTWDKIKLDDRSCLYITPDISKTATTRVIALEPNLLAYLRTIPASLRRGSICPPAWAEKIKWIRKTAGIGDLQDVCRHSYASYWLSAHNGDMGGLLERMGHTTQQTTLKHYRVAVAKPDALAYWSTDITQYINPDAIRGIPKS